MPNGKGKQSSSEDTTKSSEKEEEVKFSSSTGGGSQDLLAWGDEPVNPSQPRIYYDTPEAFREACDNLGAVRTLDRNYDDIFEHNGVIHTYSRRLDKNQIYLYELEETLKKSQDPSQYLKTLLATPEEKEKITNALLFDSDQLFSILGNSAQQRILLDNILKDKINSDTLFKVLLRLNSLNESFNQHFMSTFWDVTHQTRWDNYYNQYQQGMIDITTLEKEFNKLYVAEYAQYLKEHPEEAEKVDRTELGLTLLNRDQVKKFKFFPEAEDSTTQPTSNTTENKADTANKNTPKK